MTTMTPLKKVVRRGNRIYVVDFAGNERLVATSAESSPDLADAS